MNIEPENRVAGELLFWKAKELQCAEKFSGRLLNERALLKARLHFYDKTYHKYAAIATQPEKLYLHVLKGERRKLVLILYPGILRKLYHIVKKHIYPIGPWEAAMLEVSDEGMGRDVGLNH